MASASFFTLPSVRLRNHSTHRFSLASTSSTKNRTISKSTNDVPLTVRQSMACGAIARGTQIFAAFPVDTIKTRLQSATRLVPASSTVPITSGSNNLSRAISQGNLYSGVGVTLTGQIPYGMLTFGIYETVRTKLTKAFPDLPIWLNVTLAASIGDAIGSLWLTPSEVIKSKTQTGLYKSAISAIRDISKTSSTGPFAFYQGYLAAIARDIPFRVIQMVLFEQCKALYMKQQGKEQLSSIENLTIGAFTGTVTACITNPFDVIRTRIMSQPCGQNALYKNAMDCIIKTVSKEGPLAFFKGVGPRAFMVGPATAVFFLTYEGCKGFFKRRSKSALLISHSKNKSSISCPRRVRQYSPNDDLRFC